jgi:NitT/TauT family transport system permease protein
MKKTLSHRQALPFWVSLSAILAGWLFCTQNGLVNGLFLPSFPDLFKAFYNLFTKQGFLHDIAISTWRVWYSFLLSFIVAVPLALWMSESKLVFRVISPYIDFIRYLPVPALIPLSILFLGIDESAKIALLFIGTFFQFILMLLDDLKEIPREYYDLAYTLHYTRWQTLAMKVGAILPQIYDNSRISIGICWTYLVIAELVASESGIGHMIKEAQRFSKTPDVYAGIISIGIIGFITDYTFKRFYPVIFKYKQLTNGN